MPSNYPVLYCAYSLGSVNRMCPFFLYVEKGVVGETVDRAEVEEEAAGIVLARKETSFAKVRKNAATTERKYARKHRITAEDVAVEPENATA
jgi:hypothetical protein